MSGPVVKRSSCLILSTVLVWLALFAVGGFSNSIHAVSTDIGARVCGQNPSPAVITITQPNDDSTTNQPTLTLRGVVERTSQVIIMIDNTYNNTVAIASNQAEFSSDVTLSTGTHTITVIASEICGGQDGTDEIAITYEPAVQPSSGGVTPTVVEPVIDEGGFVVTDDAISQDDQPAPFNNAPIFGEVFNIVKDFSEAIGLNATINSQDNLVLTGVARVTLTVAAATSIVMAGSLAPVAVQSVPGVAEIFRARSHRSMAYLAWAIRGVGLLAFALAYFI